MGRDEEQLDDIAPEQSIAEVIDRLAERSEAHREVLADRDRLRFALDQQFAKPEARIGSAKELAIFPPVTGG